MGLLKVFKAEKCAPPAQPHALPEVSTTVRVRVAVPDGTADGELFVELPSKVTDIETSGQQDDRTQMVIAAPDTSFLPVMPDPSAEHTLLWTTASGQMELPVRLTGRERLDYGPVWRVLVRGPARRVQRRQYCRAPLRLPVVIELLSAEGEVAAVLQGVTVDLSEGGAFCSVAPDSPPYTGNGVVITLTLGERTMRLPAVVVRQIPSEGRKPPRWGLGLRFDDPDEYGDVIRREVFAGQLRARQSTPG
jgi:hypothetical protein